MVYYTKVTINGIEYDDYNNGEVASSTSDNNTSSTFNLNYKNELGKYNSLFEIGNEVIIKLSEYKYSLQSHWVLNTDFNDSIGSNNGTAYDENLLVHCLFNGNDDDEQGNVTFVPAGTPTYTTGKIEQSISVTDTDYVNDSSFTSIGATDNYTICFWLKVSDNSSTYTIVDMSGANVYPKITRQGTTGKLLMYCGQEEYLYSTASIDVDTWYHVAFVMNDYTDNSTWKIYINGEDESDSTGAFDETYFSPSQLKIAGKAGETTEVDDLRIYNKALTQTDVQNIYNSDNGTELTIPLISGKLSNCVSLTGTGANEQGIDLTDTITLDGEFTIACWIYLNLNNINQGWFGASALYNDGRVNFTSTGNVQVWTQEYNPTIYLTSALPTGEWFHLALTRDKDDHLVVYKNGVKFHNDDDKVAPGTIAIERLGDSPTDSSYTVLNGRIDDFRYYSSSLPIEAIQSLYNANAGTETDYPDSITIFDGIIENKALSGKTGHEKIKLSGRNYNARLQDITVPPEVYTNQVIEDIIEDLFAKYAKDVTYNKTVIGVRLERIVFKHVSLYDALKRLAELCGGMFWVDNDKVTHFTFKGTTSSGYTFDNTNITKATWTETRQELYNQVWVYGDRYLDGTEQTFSGLGAAGSVYNLNYKPSSTFVSVGGSVSKGAIDGMTTGVSGAQHLINYHDKKLIFVSGTEAGYHIPGSSTSGVYIGYDRELPIVKFGRDAASIFAYGIKEKVIVNKDIKDPKEAEDLMKATLNENSNPKTQGNIDVNGIMNLTAGQSCIINLPYDGISSKVYNMLEVKYNLTKQNLLDENLINIKLNKRIKNISDTVKDILLDLKKLQANEFEDTDIITRYEFSPGSVFLDEYSWYAKTANPSGTFVLSHPVYSLLDGVNKYGSGISFSSDVSGGSF